eukprot:2517973-Rhodomonas_salina.2
MRSRPLARGESRVQYLHSTPRSGVLAVLRRNPATACPRHQAKKRIAGSQSTNKKLRRAADAARTACWLPKPGRTIMAGDQRDTRTCPSQPLLRRTSSTQPMQSMWDDDPWWGSRSAQREGPEPAHAQPPEQVRLSSYFISISRTPVAPFEWTLVAKKAGPFFFVRERRPTSGVALGDGDPAPKVTVTLTVPGRAQQF